MRLPNGGNAYEGKIEFSNGNNLIGDLSSKFIRVPEQQSVEKTIMKHIRHVWKMNDPQFIIEISGNVKENEIAEACVRNNNQNLKKLLKKCLIDIAVKHNAWIVTDGLNCFEQAGSEKQAGLAKYFGDEIARKRAMGVVVNAFGITRWKSEWESAQPVAKDLNPGYSHFIFCGDGSNSPTSLYGDLFLLVSAKTDREDKIIPWLKLSLGSVDNLKHMLKQHPTILIEGFGGSTDEYANDQFLQDEDEDEDEGKTILERKRHGLVYFFLFFFVGINS